MQLGVATLDLATSLTYMTSSTAARWADLSGIDRRLSKALSKLGYVSPTSVQSECIPLALLGKDVMVKARTGSAHFLAWKQHRAAEGGLAV